MQRRELLKVGLGSARGLRRPIVRPRATLWALASLLLLAAASVGGSPVTAGGEDTIDVVSYNVLAPQWAAPDWYPDDMDPTLLGIELRRPLITNYLSSLAEAEVVCLQEVGLSEFQYLARALGPEFEGAMAFNDPDFWSNWLVPGYPWEPNGPAIFASTDAFDEITLRDLPLGTGNHAALVEATHAATGRTVRAWSVHLDSDRTTNRLAEVDTLLAETGSGRGATDVICGDLNDDTVVGSIAPRLRRAGFVDIHAALGIRHRTHPWSEQYYSSDRWAIIDHVLVRNGEPTAASIVDAGVDPIVDELTRIEEFLRRMGSDHYSITAAVRLPNSG